MINFLLNFWLRVQQGHVYDGGYYYEVNGEWKWFPFRNWELEKFDRRLKGKP